MSTGCFLIGLLTLPLVPPQVKSVKTGSVCWTIGCCLSYFYMVSTSSQIPTLPLLHLKGVMAARCQNGLCDYGRSALTDDTG